MSRLLTMAEVSDRLGKPIETLKRWRKTSVGPPSFLVGGSVRYDPEELDRWLSQQRATTGAGDLLAPPVHGDAQTAVR